MAYGRLDIIYPDGNFRSFPLKEAKVSVGRSPGNTITLETETISRYHFSITHEEGEVRLMDMESQNGTYVDGVKIPDDKPFVLRGGEEILVGDLRIIYYEVDEMPTQPVRADDMVTQPIEKKDVPFRISIMPPPISIPPSAHASAELTIENLSDDQAFYSVAVEGVDRDWVRIDRPKLMVDANDTAKVIINVRPIRRSETAPGEYEIRVSVREENNPTDSLEAKTFITVLPFHGFGVALEHKVIKASDRFRLHMHNQGSIDLPLVVSGSERITDVDIELVSASTVVLKPGQHLLIQGQAKPTKNNLIGAAETHPFDIVIRSQDSSQFMVVVRGKVTQTPVLPTWAVIAGAVGVVGIIGLILLALVVSVFSAADPNVIATSINSNRIVRGEPYSIFYTVEEAAELELLINGTPVAVFLPEEDGEFVLTAEQTADLPDDLSMSLIARAGRRSMTTVISESLVAYDPLIVDVLEAEPQEMVRFVVQPLSIQWDVQNAEVVRVNITGLEAFGGSESVAIEYEPLDSLDMIIDIPLEDVVVSLEAEGAQGDTIVEELTIPALLPQCSPADEAITLHDGPNPLNQEIGTVPESASVIVDGRDVSGAWVRVQENGGWGALEAFDCASNFNPAELRQIIEVIAPPQQPTQPVPTDDADAPAAVPTEPSPLNITPGAVITPTQGIPVDATPQPTSAG